jgi:GT2 family glycosyltransferase
LNVVLVHREQPGWCAKTVVGFVAQGVPVSVTVVDNGSSPSSLAALRSSLATAREAGDLGETPVEIVEMGFNAGFGPAANEGWRRWLGRPVEEAGEWSVVAPHDAMPQEGCLRRLLEVLVERPRAGLASADVGEVPAPTPVVDQYFGSIPAAITVTEGWEPAGYPHGTLMLARRACLEEIGLFDERYFAYCEEADLGERARRAGWEIGVVRGAKVVNMHLSSATPAVDYLQLRNTLLLVRDNFGRYKGSIRFATAVIQLVQGVVRPATRTEVFSVDAQLQAMGDHLRGRYGPPPERFFARSGDGVDDAEGAPTGA